jgi:hypothetical protein
VEVLSASRWWLEGYWLVNQPINERTEFALPHEKSRSRKSAQDDKWNFCLTAGTLCPANQERP